MYDVLDPVVFFDHAIGALCEARLHITLWWTITAILSGFLEARSSGAPISSALGWRFLMLFHISRCTLTYAVYILREIIDHSGLPSTSILSFTRTSPCCNLLQTFLQPYDDNYHLLHHLLPRVPMSKLHTTHEWLVENVEIYERANSRPLWTTKKWYRSNGVKDHSWRTRRTYELLPRQERSIHSSTARPYRCRNSYSSSSSLKVERMQLRDLACADAREHVAFAALHLFPRILIFSFLNSRSRWHKIATG